MPGREGPEVLVFGNQLLQIPYGRIWKELESGGTSAVVMPRGPLWLPGSQPNCPSRWDPLLVPGGSRHQHGEQTHFASYLQETTLTQWSGHAQLQNPSPSLVYPGVSQGERNGFYYKC